MGRLEEKLIELGFKKSTDDFVYTKDLYMGTIYAYLSITNRNKFYLELNDINFVTSKEDIKTIEKDLEVMQRDLEILKGVE